MWFDGIMILKFLTNRNKKKYMPTTKNLGFNQMEVTCLPYFNCKDKKKQSVHRQRKDWVSWHVKSDAATVEIIGMCKL